MLLYIQIPENPNMNGTLHALDLLGIILIFFVIFSIHDSKRETESQFCSVDTHVGGQAR